MMMVHFLPFGADVSGALVQSYSVTLVMLSYLVAVLASYAGLQMSVCIANAESASSRWVWLSSGSVAMGIGIWAMHFTGMLALTLPIPITYNFPATVMSVVPGILASGLALRVMSGQGNRHRRYIIGGALVGVGIGTMHYMGMAAMRMGAMEVYNPALFALSLIVAVLLGIVAMYTQDIRPALRALMGENIPMVLGAGVMGLATAGMHYTAMAAVSFLPRPLDGLTGTTVDKFWLSIVVAGIALAIGLVAIVAAIAPMDETQRSRRTAATKVNNQRAGSIRFKLSVAFVLITFLVTGLAVTAVAIQLRFAESAASLEAEDVADTIVHTSVVGAIHDPQRLQENVESLHRLNRRDLFVVDNERKIVADSDPKELGRVASGDDNTIEKTIRDGRTRTYLEEINPSLNRQARQIVIPLYDHEQASDRAIIGAVIFEYTDVYNNLIDHVSFLSYLMIFAGIFFVLSTSLMGSYIVRSISHPLSELKQGVTRFASGDYGRRVHLTSKDEFASLSDAFNDMAEELSVSHAKLVEHEQELTEQVSSRTAELSETNIRLQQEARDNERMTQELHDAQSELVTTARQAGMAEIANNVLHNVGNVLNSVNVSAGLVSSKMRDSKAQGLTKAVQLMNEHEADLGDFLTRDKKGKLLPGYLNKLVAALTTEQQSIVEELRSLTKSVDHITEIVATQQSYAGATTVVEAVQITDLLEDALRINAGALARHQVTVIKEFTDQPLLLLDKSRVLQILVNLIANARQAMDGAIAQLHRMTLRMDMADRGDGRCLRISVEDEGEGIAPENMARLFVHGFTTHNKGHGFGLHSCALAAKEMGGTLTARSEGRGKGAAFTLELPVNQVGNHP